jgi:ribosome-binding ATPase YchF (GTP1/OBG family)
MLQDVLYSLGIFNAQIQNIKHACNIFSSLIVNSKDFDYMFCMIKGAPNQYDPALDVIILQKELDLKDVG